MPRCPPWEVKPAAPEPLTVHCYEVTDQGLRHALFLTRSYDRLLRPGLAVLLPDQAAAPSILRASFRQLEAAMTSWAEQAKLAS